MQEGRVSVISADREGIIAVWSENGGLESSMDLKKNVSEISYSGTNKILAVNLGEEIELYSMGNFERLGNLSGDGIFRKAHFSGGKLYYIIDGKQRSRICAFDCDEDKQSIIAEKESFIVDFAVSQPQSSKTTIIYLIDSRNHLEIL